MTPKEAYERFCEHIKSKPSPKFAYEYKNLYAFRMLPGQMLCVLKDTGDVIWEDDLPLDIPMEGKPKMQIIYSELDETIF